MSSAVTSQISKAPVQLAIHGGDAMLTGTPERQPRWGEPERIQLEEMLQQRTLFYWKGEKTKLLVERFREHYPLQHVMPCSSGTAALHIAVAAAGIGPGDEVIVTPITDMGSVIGILYQLGVPVFADLEPHTYNLDVADVKRRITAKTKAIIAVHLTGNPCDMAGLKALCVEHNLVLIEDCAQAWGTMYRGQPIGTVGDIGCYSLNEFKHITCGDGGLVGSNDERFGPLLNKFGDKSYDRTGAQRFPETLAPNYRISEPQSAVAAAQMTRMWDITGRRGAVGRELSRLLQGVDGIFPHHADEEDRWTCWFYMFRINPDVILCDNKTFAAALTAEGVPCHSSYCQMPIYQYPMFREHNFFAGRWPVKEMGLTDMDYSQVSCPEAEKIVSTCVFLGVNEDMTPEWIRGAAGAIEKVAAYYASSPE